MRRPQLKSTFARAVVPVAAGIAGFAVLGMALLGVASLISHNGSQTTDRLTPTTQDMGSTEVLAGVIAKDGPIVLQDLVGSDKHIVLNHTGSDPAKNWAMYLAHPADRDASCQVTVVKRTHTFTDCTGRTITVDQLADVPQGVGPTLNNEGTLLTLDLTAK
ncbi:MAG: hypothetical protein WCI22_06965 [Actinomycetota bacterium]